MGFLGCPLWLWARFSVAADKFGNGPRIQPFLRALPSVALIDAIFRDSEHSEALIGIGITVNVVVVVANPIEPGRHINSPRWSRGLSISAEIVHAQSNVSIPETANDGPEFQRPPQWASQYALQL